MNLEEERNRLIDISLEDDFLIDSNLDSSSFDLRLSVACETQNELLCRLGHHKLKDGVPFFAEKEQDTFQLDTQNNDNECNLRRSLAWDRAFFTSPGFLELEELCLVNRGFNDPEAPLLHGGEENTRSKVCQERNSSHRAGVGAGGRQRTQSSLKPKMTSPSKILSGQDSKQQHMNTRGSDAIRGVVPKSYAVQSANGGRGYLRPTRTTDQSRVSAIHTKKPPLKGVGKNGRNEASERLGRMVSRKPDSWSVSSVSSSQSLLSSTATNNSIDFSPSKSYTFDGQTANLQKSPEMKGEYISNSSPPTSGDSQNTSNLETSPLGSPCEGLTSDVNASQNNQKFHRSPIERGGCGKGVPSHSASRATRKGSLLAEIHQSSKPSSLRMPSEKIGFFDMNSELPMCTESRSISPEIRVKNACKSKDIKIKGGVEASAKGHQRRSQQHYLKQKTDFLRKEEKENIFHPEDTVIELQLRKGSSQRSQCSSSSEKRLAKPQRPMRETMLSSATSTTRIPFSTKVSPLKRSAFF